MTKCVLPTLTVCAASPSPSLQGGVKCFSENHAPERRALAVTCLPTAPILYVLPLEHSLKEDVMHLHGRAGDKLPLPVCAPHPTPHHGPPPGPPPHCPARPAAPSTHSREMSCTSLSVHVTNAPSCPITHTPHCTCTSPRPSCSSAPQLTRVRCRAPP